MEEHTSIDTMRRLIKRLKQDFGADFIITLAPVYPALLAHHRRFMGISRRILNPQDFPTPDPIMNALCKAKGIHSKRNLSGFNHFDLEASDVGSMIGWYNVQLYCGWGDPSRPGVYETLIETGWKPEKIVMGVVTSPRSGGGYIEPGRLFPAIEVLANKYGNKFGGVMGWEYWNAGMYGLSPNTEGPWVWAQGIGRASTLR